MRLSFEVVNDPRPELSGQAPYAHRMIRRRHSRVARPLVCVLAALALFATSCGGSSAVDTATAPAVEAPATDTAPAEADPAPAAEASLIADTVNGGQIDFGALAGQDVVLWFWAPW